MRFPGVFLSLAVLCCVLPSTVAATAQTMQPDASNRLDVPFPNTHNPQALQQWRQQVRSRLEARRADPHANAPSGASNGIIETLAGAAPFPAPVNALKTGFGVLEGIAEDSSGNLYVASCDLGIILKIDRSSNTTIFAGRPLPVGIAAAAGDGGPATEARLPCPFGIVVDNSNNVYVSDTVSNTIREIDAGTNTIHTIAGISGESGYSGDGGQATSAHLDSPTALTLDGAGNLFIANLRYVRRLDLASGVIQTLAGTVQSPQCYLTASTTCPGNQVSFEIFGNTLTFSRGLLYAAPSYLQVSASSEFPTGAIMSIDPGTAVVRLLAGGGPFAGSSSSYPDVGLELDPQGITADATGNVYTTGPNQPPAAGPGPDTSASFPLIEELQTSDYSLHVVAGVASTSPGYAGDGGPAAMATLYAPATICVSPTGSLVFVDTFNIRSFPVGGNITTIAGDGSANFFGDGGQAQQAGLDDPSGVAADSQGNVYIADTDNGRVRKIDIATGVVTTVAGGGTLYGAAGDGKPALQAALFPTDVAPDNSNHLYIRDYLGLRMMDLSSGMISTLLPNVTTSGQMLFDGDHTLYIGAPHVPLAGGTAPSLNDQVWAVDLNTGATTVIAGQGQLTNTPSGDGGPATQAVLWNVMGLALDGQGHLYLTDSGFCDVRQIDLGTGIISTTASSHPEDGFLCGYSGDGGLATAATFDSPTGLAYDGAGHLTIVDSANHVLRQIDLATNVITTIAGNHSPGFDGDGGSPTAAMLYDPHSAAYDPTGNLVIGDAQNDRVRRVVLHPTNLKATLTYSGGQSPSGDSITYIATYNELSFGIAPTGSVTFLNGSVSLGTGAIAAATDGSGNYVATFTSTSLPAENATITAQYSGDVHYAASTTSITFQQLSPSYTVSANPAALTVSQGSSGSVTFTVTPQNGFNTAVSFSCDGTTLPKGVTCSFSPASVTPNGAAVTTTLTVQTTGSTVAALRRTPFSGWLPGGGAALALLLLGIPHVRRKAWPGGIALLLFACCFAGVAGCGGGGSNSGGGGTQNANSTPPGSYSIQVTTSAGTVSAAAPLTVALTVTQ